MLVLLSLLACEDPVVQATVAELSAPGRWRVGYREESVTYDADRGPGRTLRVAHWYPTAATSGGEVRYQGAFPAPDVLDAPAEAPGDFPVVVFSHGHQATAETSGRILSHLASHGFAVWAPDHAGNTAFDGPERETSIYAWRASDIGAVLDHAGAEEALAMGHSFGGYTVFGLAGAGFDADVVAGCDDGTAFCSTMDPEWAATFAAGVRDPRVVAAIAMAPGDWRLYKDGLAEVEMPVLHLTGALDQNVGPDNDPIWADLDDPADLRVHLPRGGHATFTDFAGAFDVQEGELDAETGWEIVRVSTLAWTRRHLLDDPAVDAVLSGEVAVSPEAEWRVRE